MPGWWLADAKFSRLHLAESSPTAAERQGFLIPFRGLRGPWYSSSECRRSAARAAGTSRLHRLVRLIWNTRTVPPLSNDVDRSAHHGRRDEESPIRTEGDGPQPNMDMCTAKGSYRTRRRQGIVVRPIGTGSNKRLRRAPSGSLAVRGCRHAALRRARRGCRSGGSRHTGSAREDTTATRCGPPCAPAPWRGRTR